MPPTTAGDLVDVASRSHRFQISKGGLSKHFFVVIGAKVAGLVGLSTIHSYIHMEVS